ncbi:DNA polymerase III subunit delta [Colwellia sp. MEBiC06753]
MRIYHNQLIQTLNQQLAPVWLIFGDEPWQKNDSLYQVKNAAQAQGYEEVIRFTVDDKFSWDELTNEYNALSLFASQRIIELEFLSTKVNDAGAKVLQTICDAPNPDTLLLCHGDKLDSATTNKKWFKSLSNLGIYLPIYDLDAKGLRLWLNRQVKQYQLSLEPASIDLMLSLFEGNVLALDQELQKLTILFGHQPVPFDVLSDIVINQAKFNPFALIDNLLLGNTSKCLLILDQMQQEGVPFAKVLWFLNKELTQLKQMHALLQSNIPINEVFKTFKVWDKRKPLYQHVLSKSNLKNTLIALNRIADVDLISKTSSEFNPFQLLADICICVYHGEQLAPLSLAYNL